MPTRDGSVTLALVYLLTSWVCLCASSSVIDLTQGNIQHHLASYDTILVNFYADWCRFSQIFAPIFEEAGSQATVTFQNGAVAFAKVNCEAEVGLAGQYEIKKYPTIKLFKFGMPLKREYRGPRTIKSILQYIEENLNPRITFHPETQTPDGIVDERAIVGYFPAFNNTVPAYLNFLKLSFFLSDCNLHAIPSPNVTSVFFIQKSNPPKREGCPEKVLSSINDLTKWAADICTPLVRRLTFANAEEITELNLPLLVLFHHPDDVETVAKFKSLMEQHFSDFQGRFSVLYADGKEFSHPLMHLGKELTDLPLLAIDSFQHMYLFPGNVTDALKDPTAIRQFTADLHSGKLHRQFHGQLEPDSTEAKPQTRSTTAAIPSVFKLLAPSHNRYTLLHEEL
uniref:Endoplasmic reticulum resident protein 44 n=1 Tax=Schistocephalus solidus TaxID=70667 RepID=A0A0X3P9A6_SCHSO